MQIDINFIEQFGLTVIDIFIFYFFCSKFFEKKSSSKWFNAALIFISFIVLFFIAMNVSDIFAKFILVLFSINLIMFILFKTSRVALLVVTVITYSFIAISDYIVLELVHLEMIKNSIFLIDDYELYTLVFLSRLSVFSIVFSIIKNKNYRLYLSPKQWLRFVAIIILAMVGIIFYVQFGYSDKLYLHEIMPNILVVNILLTYYILNDLLMMNSELIEKRVSEERMASEINLWRKLKDKDTINRKMLHDYSNVLICINGLLAQNKIDELKDYINNICVDYKLAKSVVKTGNALLDVLISTKYEYALENDIVMILKLDSLENISVKNEDMIVIISNLLDNAIECCKKLKIKNKQIIFSINSGDKINIIVRNPIEDKVIVKNSLIKTTKQGANHGIGLGNIKDIVQKNNGTININTDGGYFTYSIEI